MTGTKGRKTRAGVIHKQVCTPAVSRAHAHAQTHGKTCSLFLQSIASNFIMQTKSQSEGKWMRKKERKKEKKKRKEV